MNSLTILLMVLGVVLILVFIIVGIYLIYLIRQASKILTEVEGEINAYKKRISPILNIFDNINGFFNKIAMFFKRKNRKEE